MPMFEIIAAGYDGSTDETDDHVIWVKAPSIEVVERHLKESGATISGELPDNCACDFVLTELTGYHIGLQARLNELASDLRNKNRTSCWTPC